MVIVKSEVNQVVIEISERATLTSPYYLFHFENVQSHQNYYCVCENLSTILQRSDEFSIEDKVGPVATDGEVNLPAGEYHVKIYEQASSTNVDPALATTLLKEDRWTVAGEEAEVVAYNGASNTGTAYGG